MEKGWLFSQTLGVNYKRTDLSSYIETEMEQENKRLGEGYVNAMQNAQLNFAADLRIGWEHAQWKLNFGLPYNLYYFNVEQQGVKTLDNTLKQTFNPRAGLTYILNPNNEFATSLSGGRSYGGLDNFYNGYIIGQYRNMQRYDARLLRTDNKSAQLRYNYKNTLKANFANFAYSYSEDSRDYIFTTHIDALGRPRTHNDGYSGSQEW